MVLLVRADTKLFFRPKDLSRAAALTPILWTGLPAASELLRSECRPKRRESAWDSPLRDNRPRLDTLEKYVIVCTLDRDLFVREVVTFCRNRGIVIQWDVETLRELVRR